MKKVVKESATRTTKKVATAKSAKKVVKVKATKKQEPTVDELKKQVKELKKRVKELESSLASAQSEIAALKAKYEPQKNSDGKYEWDEKSVTYLDVYDRVQNFMAYNTGFAPDDGIGEEDVVDICTDEEGNEHKHWTNPRAFVGGDENESSVFEEVAYLDDIYYKLASRWDAEFVDACRILGTVKVKDRSPAGIMKALDEAGL